MRIGFAILSLVLLAFTESAVDAGAKIGVAPSQCNPAHAKTVEARGGVRVYSVGREASEGPFGCLLRSGRTRSLEVGAGKYRGGFPWFEDIAIAAPWVAYEDYFLIGVDTADLYVVAKNLGSGPVRRCFVEYVVNGGGPAESRFLVKNDGSIAWAVHDWAPFGRVGACDRNGSSILDSGPGLDVGSLALHGGSLSWSREGILRFARLH